MKKFVLFRSGDRADRPVSRGFHPELHRQDQSVFGFLGFLIDQKQIPVIEFIHFRLHTLVKRVFLINLFVYFICCASHKCVLKRRILQPAAQEGRLVVVNGIQIGAVVGDFRGGGFDAAQAEGLHDGVKGSVGGR